MHRYWQYSRYNYNRRPIVYQGVNLWAFPWRSAGQYIDIDLLDGTTASAPIFEIRQNGRSIFFAAIEKLPDYWIFAAKDEPFDSGGSTANPRPTPPQLSGYDSMPECMQGHY